MQAKQFCRFIIWVQESTPTLLPPIQEPSAIAWICIGLNVALKAHVAALFLNRYSYSTCDWICLKLGFREKKNHNLNRFSSALLYKLHWSHIIRPLVEWLDNLHWISDWLSFAKGLRLNRQLHDNLNCASGDYAKKIKSRKSEDKKNPH